MCFIKYSFFKKQQFFFEIWEEEKTFELTCNVVGKLRVLIVDVDPGFVCALWQWLSQNPQFLLFALTGRGVVPHHDFLGGNNWFLKITGKFVL